MVSRAKAGLTDRENIFECYPKLLMSRAKDYAAMADSTITHSDVFNEELSDEDLLMMLKPVR